MKDGIATHSLPDECFIIQIDGRVKSGHRGFLDALRVALHLKYQFPGHDVKLRDAREDRESRSDGDYVCTDLCFVCSAHARNTRVEPMSATEARGLVTLKSSTGSI